MYPRLLSVQTRNTCWRCCLSSAAVFAFTWKQPQALGSAFFLRRPVMFFIYETKPFVWYRNQNSVLPDSMYHKFRVSRVNPLNSELTLIPHLLAILGARHILRVSRIRVNYLSNGCRRWLFHCFSLRTFRSVQILTNRVNQRRLRMLVSGTQVRGFEPGRSRRIFQGEKILSMPSFGGEVKPSVPCRGFALCKWSLQIAWNSLFDGKIHRAFLARSSHFPS
jgi:hypothetical protein